MDSRHRDIGRRVSYWRIRRGLTRQQFADLVGRSMSWVDKVETGQRGLVRLPMLEAVANALRVDVAALADDVAALADDVAARSATHRLDALEVRAIRAALGSYRVILGGTCDPPDLARLRGQVDYACAAWLSSHFTTMGRVLPGLLADAQCAVEALGGADRLEATRCLVMAYRLTSSTLLKFGTTELAWLAADRAMLAARSGYYDPVNVFGVTNVALHRLAALVRLEDSGRAVEYARTIDQQALARLPTERKAAYLLDLTEAHRQCRQHEEATAALVKAEQIAPEEVRSRPAARALIQQLLDACTGHPAQQLRQLADRAGVAA